MAFLSQSSSRWTFIFWLHVIVLIWGFSGSLGRLIALGSLELVWLRTAIASIALIGFMLMRSRPLVLPPFRDCIRLAGLGVLIAIHWLTFFECIKQSNVSIALACLSTGPLFVAIIEPIAFKRRIASSEVLLAVGVLSGMLLALGNLQADMYAIALGISSSAIVSLFAVSNAFLVKRIPSDVISLWELGVAALALTLVLLYRGEVVGVLSQTSAMDWGWLLILALVCTTFAFTVSVQIMKRLTPFTVVLTVALEPVYGILIALAIFGETEAMSSNFYVGVLAVLAMVGMNGWLKRTKSPSKQG
ncbi:MAG: DMT family transporter [Flavobacteriales bacterium]|jgi:drug/metabolite transporter (DMT)-like permease|tara:strand:+ start:551 stop:1459 length:909 start_codon:yes stop_codon:yes gene_type:complete